MESRTKIYNFRSVCQNSFKNQTVQKNWHKNNIKGHFNFFCQNGDPYNPLFWNTFAADKLYLYEKPHRFSDRGKLPIYPFYPYSHL